MNDYSVDQTGSSEGVDLLRITKIKRYIWGASLVAQR